MAVQSRPKLDRAADYTQSMHMNVGLGGVFTMLQYVNSAGEVVDAHGRPLSQATDLAPDAERFEDKQHIHDQSDAVDAAQSELLPEAGSNMAEKLPADGGRSDSQHEAKREADGTLRSPNTTKPRMQTRFEGEVEMFLQATSGGSSRSGMGGNSDRAPQKPQQSSARQLAADTIADRHAVLASSLLEAIEAILSSFTLPASAAGDGAVTPGSSPSGVQAGGAEAATASATAALSARVIASLSFLEVALGQFKGSHGQVAAVLLSNLRSAVVKPVHPETARVLLEAAQEATLRRDAVTATAVHEVLGFPATLQRIVSGVAVAVAAQAGRLTGDPVDTYAPPPMSVAEMQELGHGALQRMVAAQRVVSTALSRRLNLLPPPPPEDEDAPPPVPPSDNPVAAFIGKGGREHPLRAMERQLVLASAAPTYAGEAAQLAILAERQCAHVAGLEAAREKMTMMIDKTQRIINSTAVRLQGALLGRYFTVWRKQTSHSKRQLGSLAAMLRRQARNALLRSCFDALITEGRSNKVGRLQAQLDDLQTAVARASESRQSALSEVSSLEAARVALLDTLDAMRRRNASHSVELERAIALQRVLPEYNLRRLAGAWLTMSDRVFESQMDRVFRQVETLAGGVTPPPPPGADASAGGAQGGSRASHKTTSSTKQRFGAEMYPPTKRGHRVSQGGDMGWEGQHLVNPLLLLTDKELEMCRAAAAAADGYGQGGVQMGPGGRPVTAPAASGSEDTAAAADRPFDGGALPPLPPFEAAALRVLISLPLDILLLRWSNHHLLNANGAVWQDWWRVWNAEAEGIANVPAPGVQNTEQLRALHESVQDGMRTALRRDRGLKLAHELMEVGFVREIKGVQGGASGPAESEKDFTASIQLSREGAVEASLAAALGQDEVDAAEVFRQKSGIASVMGSGAGVTSPSFNGLGQASGPAAGVQGGYIPGAGSPELSSRLGGGTEEGRGGVDLTPHGVVAGPTVRYYHAMARIRRRATLAAAAARARGPIEVQGGNTGVASTGGGTTGYGAADMGHTETGTSAPLLVAENVGDDWQSGHAYALLLHRLSVSNAFACAQHVTVGAAALTDMPFVMTPHSSQGLNPAQAQQTANTWGREGTDAVQLQAPSDTPSPWRAATLGRLAAVGFRPTASGGLSTAQREAAADAAFSLHARSAVGQQQVHAAPGVGSGAVTVRLPPCVPVVGMPPVTAPSPLLLVPTVPPAQGVQGGSAEHDPAEVGVVPLADVAAGRTATSVAASGGYTAYAALYQRSGAAVPPPTSAEGGATALAPWLSTVSWPVALNPTCIPHPSALRVLPYALRHVDNEGRAEEVVARLTRMGAPRGLLQSWHITGGQTHAAANLTALAYMFCRWPELRTPLGWVSAVREAPELAVKGAPHDPSSKSGAMGSPPPEIAKHRPGVRVQSAAGKRLPMLVPFAWLSSAREGGASSPQRPPTGPSAGHRKTRSEAFHQFESKGSEGGLDGAYTPHASIHVPPLHTAFDRSPEETVAAIAGALSIGDDVMLAHPLTLKRLAEVCVRLRVEWRAAVTAYTAHVHSYHAYAAYAAQQQAAMANAKRHSVGAAATRGGSSLGSPSREKRGSPSTLRRAGSRNNMSSRGGEGGTASRGSLRGSSPLLSLRRGGGASSSGGLDGGGMDSLRPPKLSIEKHAANSINPPPPPSAWLNVRLSLSAVATFSAALAYVQGVIERAMAVRRGRWGMWLRLREHVQAASWAAMRRRGAGQPVHVVDRREQRCLRSVTQVPLLLVADCAPRVLHVDRTAMESSARGSATGPGTPKSSKSDDAASDGGGTTPKSRGGGSRGSKRSDVSGPSSPGEGGASSTQREAALAEAAEAALAALQRSLAPQLQRWYTLLKRVFAYYAAAEEGGSSTAMDWREWLHFCRECRLVRADQAASVTMAAKRAGAFKHREGGGGAGMGGAAVLVAVGNKSVNVTRPTEEGGNASDNVPESGLSRRELQLIFVASMSDVSQRQTATDQLLSALRRGDRMFEPEHELRQSEFVACVLRTAVAFFARERSVQRIRDRLTAAAAASSRAAQLAEALGMGGRSKEPARAGALSITAKLQLGSLTTADVAELKRSRPDVHAELVKRGAVTRGGEIVPQALEGGADVHAAPEARNLSGPSEAGAAAAPLRGKAKRAQATGRVDRAIALRLRLTHDMGMQLVNPPEEDEGGLDASKSPRAGSRGKGGSPRTGSRGGSRPRSRGGASDAAAPVVFSSRSATLDEGGDLEMMGCLQELGTGDVTTQVDEWISVVYGCESLNSHSMRATIHPCGALEALMRFHMERFACKSSANNAEWKSGLRDPGVRGVLTKYKPQLTGIYLMYVRQQAEAMLGASLDVGGGLRGGSGGGPSAKDTQAMLDSVVASGAGAMSVENFVHLLRVCGLLAGNSTTGRMKARSVSGTAKLSEVDVLAALVRVTQANVDALYEGDDEEVDVEGGAAGAKTPHSDAGVSPRTKKHKKRKGGGAVAAEAGGPPAETSSASALYIRCDKALARMLLNKEQRTRWRKVHGSRAHGVLGVGTAGGGASAAIGAPSAAPPRISSAVPASPSASGADAGATSPVMDLESSTGALSMTDEGGAGAAAPPPLVAITPSTELSYTAFVECLVALAVTLFPSPYSPLQSKLDTFMGRYVLTGFQKVDTKGGKGSNADSSADTAAPARSLRK